MSRRHNEEEKAERIIRSLLKRPDNRRCINCNSLGPQYVCITFSTFICTNCSGIHREFTHRVKSISMAKFKAEEVIALQTGGNERAKEIYFKTWDPIRNTLLDGCNLHRLRDFIKHVYVDRRYSGDKMLTIVKTGSREENTTDWCFLERKNSNNEVSDKSLTYYMDQMRSTKFRSEIARFSSPRPRSTAKFEIVDDRFREDVSEPRRLSRHLSNIETRTATSLSPDPQATSIKKILPMLQKVKKDECEREKNIFSPNVVERLKENGNEHAQKPASSNFQKMVVANVVEPRLQKTGFSTCSSTDTPRLPYKEAASLQLSGKASASSITTTGGNNNSFVRSYSIPNKASSVPSMNTSLEALFELSVPSLVPQSTTHEPPNISNAPPSPSIATYDSVCAHVTHKVGPTHEKEITCSNDSSLNLSQQQHQPDSPVLNNEFAIQQNNSFLEHNTELWNSKLSNSPVSQAVNLTITTQQLTEPPVSRLSQESCSANMSSKSGARMELPVDLFTLCYPSNNARVPSWQYHHPSQGMGYNMHYKSTASLPSNTFSNLASRNPFDIGDDENTEILRSQMYHSTSYPQQVNTHVQPQSLPYTTLIDKSIPFSLPPSRSFDSVGDAFGSFNTTLQHVDNINYNNTTHTCPNSYTHGNPFG